MKNYVVYDLEGKILRTGTCPDDMIEIQAGENEMVMEGVVDDTKHRIKDGKIVEHKKTPEEIEEETQANILREKEMKTHSKMQEILRRMAIEELEKEGK